MQTDEEGGVVEEEEEEVVVVAAAAAPCACIKRQKLGINEFVLRLYCFLVRPTKNIAANR